MGRNEGRKVQWQRVRECERERETRNAILIGEEKHGAIINTSVFGASAMEDDGNRMRKGDESVCKKASN
jgi:hypothetical protein